MEKIVIYYKFGYLLFRQQHIWRMIPTLKPRKAYVIFFTKNGKKWKNRYFLCSCVQCVWPAIHHMWMRIAPHVDQSSRVDSDSRFDVLSHPSNLSKNHNKVVYLVPACSFTSSSSSSVLGFASPYKTVSVVHRPMCRNIRLLVNPNCSIVWKLQNEYSGFESNLLCLVFSEEAKCCGL